MEKPDLEQEKRINKKASIFKNIKRFSTVLKGSSSYWEGTLSNIGKNIFSSNPDDSKKLMIDHVKIKEVKENENFKINVKQEPQSNLDISEQKLTALDLNKTDYQELSLEEKLSQTKSNLIMNKRNWTHEEDCTLLNIANSTSSKNWRKISTMLTNKTSQQCSYRYNKLTKPPNKRKWSRNDDIILIEQIEVLGKNWDQIATKMPGRTPNEIRERFEKKLDPKFRRCKFDTNEDDQIVSLFTKYGNQWKEIAKFFPDRNDSMIKNRYYSHLRKKLLNKDNSSSVYSNISQEQFSEMRSTSSSLNNYIKINDNENYAANSHFESNSVARLNTSSNTESTRKTISYNETSILKRFNNTFQWEKDGIQFNHETNSNLNKNSEFLIKNMNEDELAMKVEDFGDNLSMKEKCLNSSYNSCSLNEDFNDLYKNRHNLEVKLDPNIFDKRKLHINLNYNNMMLNDYEANNIPEELIKIETDSPKLKDITTNFNIDTRNVDYNNDFNKNYEMVFKTKTASFEDNDINSIFNYNMDDNYFDINDNNIRLVDNSPCTINNQNSDNENLMIQFKVLEDVFEKVKEVIQFHSKNTNFRINSLNQSLISPADLNSKDYEAKKLKFSIIQLKLDERRDNLSFRLNCMKDEYSTFISREGGLNLDLVKRNQIVKSLLMKQIEILIELIKTTKLKMHLMQQYENRYQ